MHIPIFAKETEEIVKKNNFNSICDCTFGTGGHTKIFLQYCNNVTAFDRDINVKKYTKNLGNLNFINDKFSNITNYIEQSDLIFADLGMSTLQLESDRGFAYLKNTELDMRMSEDYSQLKLKSILNKMPMYKIKEIIKNYGEEKNATKIASNIEKYRLHKDINTTFDLRDAIGFDQYSVLSRVFQAFRIFVNDEIFELETLLKSIKQISNHGLFITFHSIEDRIVKNYCKSFKYNGFLLPSEEEIEFNPKSRSAKLRYFSNSIDFSQKNFV